MTELERRSPLPEGSRACEVPGFTLRELDAVTKLRVQMLRSRGTNSSAAAVGQLPLLPATAAGVDPIALWGAPDDWLVYSRALTVQALNDWVAALRSEAPLVITDVSSASVVFELSGPRSVDILLRDCTLDLEGGAIHPGACAQTAFAQTRVMIHRPFEVDLWRLFVERSVARHVWEWLLDTAGAVSGVPSRT